MKIRIVSPFPEGVPFGSNVTGYRWAAMLAQLGHDVLVTDADRDEACDLLIALHLETSAAAVHESYRSAPARPVFVAVGGRELAGGAKPGVQRAAELATRILTFQAQTPLSFPKPLQHKTQVIYPSAPPLRPQPLPRRDCFVVCVPAHLNRAKDPLRAAMAARDLPAHSRIQVEHFGEDADPELAEAARRETARGGRYRWSGLVPNTQMRARLASSHLAVFASETTTGNAIAEALVDRVAILAARGDSNVGLLGEKHPGYFEPGDTKTLTELMFRAESDPAFLKLLRAATAEAAKKLRAAEERRVWQKLLASRSPKKKTPAGSLAARSGRS